VDLYVRDGASLTRPILRRRGGTPIGHSPIRDQLVWCGRQRVARAIFTHCGSQLVFGGRYERRPPPSDEPRSMRRWETSRVNGAGY
jgi:hypothetical protein